MAACFQTMQQHANCCSTFSAGFTSALYGRILDTVILAVSILLALIIPVLPT